MLKLTLPNNVQATWRPYDKTIPDMDFTDPAEFVHWMIHFDTYGCPIYTSHIDLLGIMAKFATQIWVSNAQQPSSIWVGKDGDKFFVGYTFDEDDYYSAACQYIQKISI